MPIKLSDATSDADAVTGASWPVIRVILYVLGGVILGYLLSSVVRPTGRYQIIVTDTSMAKVDTVTGRLWGFDSTRKQWVEVGTSP